LYGSDRDDALWADPLAVEDVAATHGWLGDLRNDKVLSDCEVPLALLYWSKRGIEFVDVWAVRRRVTVRRPSDRPYSWLLSPRHHAETEAQLYQFQVQLEALRTAHPSPETISATAYFRYLPSAGFLRVAGGAGGKAFSVSAFLQGIVQRSPVFIEGARLESLFRMALQYPAFDLEDPTMLWLYATRQNSQAIAAGSDPQPAAYLVFASGQLPFIGHARFDVSQWDYANLGASFDEGVFA